MKTAKIILHGSTRYVCVEDMKQIIRDQHLQAEGVRLGMYLAKQGESTEAQIAIIVGHVVGVALGEIPRLTDVNIHGRN